MADGLDQMLEPGERVVWRDPSRVRLMLPYYLMYGIVITFLVSPGLLAFPFLDWTWDLALFPAVLLAVCLALLWITGRSAVRRADGAVTSARVLYRSKDGQSPNLDIPLAEVVGVAMAADAAVQVIRQDGGIALLPGLWRPARFAHAVAKAARVPGAASPGRLDRFGAHCWLLGGLVFVMAGELLSNTLMPGGPSPVVTEFVGRVLLRTLFVAASLWIGAHLTCALGLVVARCWISAGEVRAWLNARPEASSDWALYRWSLWKSRPYFRLAEVLWGEPMNGPNAEAAHHG